MCKGIRKQNRSSRNQNARTFRKKIFCPPAFSVRFERLLSAIRENSPHRGSDNRSVAETNSNLTTKASHGQCNFFLKVLAVLLLT